MAATLAALVAVYFSPVLNLGSVLVSGLMLVLALAGAIFGLRLKASLTAAESARDSWKQERDAEKAHADRLTEENRKLTERAAAAEGRSDLTPLMKQNADLITAVHEMAIASTSRHEKFAQHLESNAKLVQGLIGQMNGVTDVLTQVAMALQLQNSH